MLTFGRVLDRHLEDAATGAIVRVRGLAIWASDLNVTRILGHAESACPAAPAGSGDQRLLRPADLRLCARGTAYPERRARYCTVEKSVGRQNSLRMLATILSGVSLAIRAEIQSGSATNAGHFSSRSASDYQAIR